MGCIQILKMDCIMNVYMEAFFMIAYECIEMFLFTFALEVFLCLMVKQ